MCLLLSPIVFAVIFLLLIFNLQETNFSAMLPIAAEGITPIMQGVKDTILPFLGIEILFFLQMYMKESEQKALSFNVGIAVVSITHLGITILSYAKLSLESTKAIVFPLVALAQEVEIIEGVIERYEPVMITLWIVTIFNTLAIIHFLTTKLINEEFLSKMKHSTIAIFIGFLSFLIAFFPDSIQETFLMGEFVSYLGFLLIVCMLIIGYVTLLFSKKRNKYRNETF